MRFICILLVLFSIGCGNTQGFNNLNQIGGGLLGGIGGGIAGSQIGGGTGNIAATIGGTILGTALGSYIGSYLDRIDMQNTNNVLERQSTGSSVQWQNPNTGLSHQVTPINTYQTSNGQYCREYVMESLIENEVQQVYGTACRQSNGFWKIIK